MDAPALCPASLPPGLFALASSSLLAGELVAHQRHDLGSGAHVCRR